MAKSSRRRAQRSEQSSDERRAAEDAKHAPVELASGASYDREALQDNLEKVHENTGRDRDQHVRKALESSENDTGHTEAVSTMPGHKIVKTEVQLSPGSEIETDDGKQTVGEVTATEFRQVVDPKADKDLLSAATGGQAVTGHRSEVTHSEDSEPAEAEAETAGEDA